MHRDVRTMFYALCNGRRFTLWHVLHYEPLINVELKDIGKVWVPLLDMVWCRSVWPMGSKEPSSQAGRSYESLPAEWGSVFGAGEPLAEHCGVFQDLSAGTLKTAFGVTPWR
jgi:hypothetical protein